MLGVGGKDLGLYALQLATFTLKSILRMDKHHKIEMAHIQEIIILTTVTGSMHTYFVYTLHVCMHKSKIRTCTSNRLHILSSDPFKCYIKGI